MSHDRVLRACLLDHDGRDFTGERAFALPIQILRRHADLGVSRGLGDRMQRSERGSDDDFHVDDVLDEASELLHEHDRFLHGLEHLPVASDHWGPHKYLWVLPILPYL